MTGRRLLYHSLFLLALPLIVAGLDLSLAGALGLVLLALLWRWGISLSAVIRPAPTPALELETIAASHFAEKVRWCLDRSGLDYSERQVGGTLGVFFRGRTVPQLRAVTGAVRSTIGNSPDILRFLWGRYATQSGDRLAFLAPTEERLALEERIDRYGVDLQVWVYYHALRHRRFTLHVWGANDPGLPRWQRAVLRACYPLLRGLIARAFRLSGPRYEQAVARIDAFLDELEQRLEGGRQALLGDALSYVDFSAAALSGPWLWPPGFGGGKSDAVAPGLAGVPADMQADIDRWRARYPHFTAFVEQLYTRERGVARG
jgi:glutathione S-transferase